MAIRINNARDFAGRTYLTTEALSGFITGFELTGNVLALTVNANGTTAEFTADLGNLVTATGAEFLTVTSNNITDTALSTFLGTTNGAAFASKIVTTDASGHLEYANAKVTAIASGSATALDTNIPTEKAVKDYVDNHGISLTSTDSSVTITNTSGVTQNLATNLYIKKLATATDGYAASYQLQIGNGTGATAIGDKIDIIKDQFLKSAQFIAKATQADVTAAGENPGFAVNDPVLKLVFSVSTKPGTTDDVDTTTYIPVKELVDVYTAGNGIDITSNVVSVEIESTTAGKKVFTAAGTQTTLIESTANGIVVADINAAISTAVRDEHAKMSAAVTAVETNVSNLQSSTSAAISTLDSNVDTLQANTLAAVGGLASDINALDSKTSGAIASVNTNLSNAVSSAMANVSSAVTTHTANAVQMLETPVTPSLKAQTTATYVATVNANNIVAVYGTSECGAQIYPLITRTAATNSAGAYNYTLEADYGTAQESIEQWTVLYTLPLSAYNATAVTTGSAAYVTNTVNAGTINATSDVTAPAAPTAVTVSGLTYDTVNNG